MFICLSGKMKHLLWIEVWKCAGLRMAIWMWSCLWSYVYNFIALRRLNIDNKWKNQDKKRVILQMSNLKKYIQFKLFVWNKKKITLYIQWRHMQIKVLKHYSLIINSCLKIKYSKKAKGSHYLYRNVIILSYLHWCFHYPSRAT